jgi:hypothetical protein
MFRQGSATCCGSTLVAVLTLMVASIAVGGEDRAQLAKLYGPRLEFRDGYFAGEARWDRLKGKRHWRAGLPVSL